MRRNTVALVAFLFIVMFGFIVFQRSRSTIVIKDHLTRLNLRPTSLGASVEENRKLYNIVLISVDTLRADHLGCYGYSRNTTPHIDSLAAQGILFERAYNPLPKTTPSLVSMLSGQLPLMHGVVNLGEKIPNQIQLLSETLHSVGYATGGVCGQLNCHGSLGFNRGFEYFDDIFQYEPLGEIPPEIWQHGFVPEVEKRASVVVDSALSWLESIHDSRRPFFLWTHLMDPHAGYSPPTPFDMKFSGEAPYLKNVIYGPNIPLALIHPHALMGSETNWSKYVNRYDGEISYLDEHVGRLLDFLSQQNLLEDTIIVFTTDHGEFMGSRGNDLIVFNHGNTFDQSEILSPLIVKLPHGSAAGIRSSNLVSIMDIMPMLTELTGTDRTPLNGINLLYGVSGLYTGSYERTLVVQLPGSQALFSLLTSDKKFIVDFDSTQLEMQEQIAAGKSLQPIVYLIDLAKDPLERNPLRLDSETLPEAVTNLVNYLTEHFNSIDSLEHSKSEKVSEVIEQLQSLGYLN